MTALSNLKINGFLGKKVNMDMSDINILVGVNGSGKTFILEMINSILSNDINNLSMDLTESVELSLNNGETFLHNSKGVVSNVSHYSTCYITGHNILAFDQMSVGKKNLTLLDDKIDELIKLLETYKEHEKFLKVYIKLHSSIADYIGKEKTISQYKILSNAEKKIIYMLFKIAIAAFDDAIIIIDDPEISLSVHWQRKMISTIRKINTNSQIIMSTHSPFIFSGVGDENIKNL